MTARPTKLFIACGETYRSGKASGVERVVRMTALHAPSVAGRYGLTVQSVCIEEAGIALLDERWVDQKRATSAPVSQTEFARRMRWYLHRAKLAVAGLLRGVLPAQRVAEFVHMDLNDHAPMRFWRSLTRGAAEGAGWIDLAQDQTGSILLLAEVTWTRREWPTIRRFREKGGAVVVLVYDLIPILTPENYSLAMQVHYRAWLDEQRRVATGFVAISATVAGQLRSFLDGSGTPVRHALLGSDPIGIGDVAHFDALPTGLRDKGRHLFLVVGMLAPRKNHGFILDAFEQYWAQGGTAALAIVANFAWESDQLLARLERHTLSGTRLFYLPDANDAMLERLYAEASGLVFASRAEGFGLPLIEALQRGLPVLCSDIPVFHELADGWARFFDVGDPQALSDALLEFDALHPPGQAFTRQPMPWQSWKQSVETMIAEIVEIVTASGGPGSE